LVELLFSLPGTYKVGFGRRKKLLRETAKDVLPASVLARKDKKFFVLQRDWMQLRERHAGAIRDAAHSEALARLPGIRKQMTRQFIDAYLAGRHDNAFAVWRIFTAVRWAEQFAV
jgi:asparagine synthetase B (glutamine-hydrolysing)